MTMGLKDASPFFSLGKSAIVSPVGYSSGEHIPLSWGFLAYKLSLISPTGLLSLEFSAHFYNIETQWALGSSNNTSKSSPHIRYLALKLGHQQIKVRQLLILEGHMWREKNVGKQQNLQKR